MFKFVIEVVLFLLIVVGIITQIILPMFMPSLRYFWIFYSDKKDKIKSVDEAIDNLANELSENKTKMKESLEKVDNTIEKLNQVKNK